MFHNAIVGNLEVNLWDYFKLSFITVEVCDIFIYKFQKCFNFYSLIADVGNICIFFIRHMWVLSIKHNRSNCYCQWWRLKSISN